MVKNKKNEVIVIAEFLLLLENIPMILQYFLPGYWAITLFSFLSSKKINKKVTLVLSCLFSYLSISLISLFRQINNTLTLSGISFILLSVLTIITSILYSSKWFKGILIKLFHKTPHSDIWHDVLDLNKGSNLKVYFKNSDIGLIGHHKVHEENGEDSWFAISAPMKFNVTTDTIVDDKNKDNENIVVTFRLIDVEHIEIF